MDPEEAADLMRAAGLEPLEPYPGTDTPWRCRCTVCGTIGSPTHGSIKRQQGGCQPCGRAKAGVGISAAWKRRMAEPRRDQQEASDYVNTVGLEPLEPYPGPSTLWRCRHDRCRREVTIRLANLRRGLRACPYCPPHEAAKRRYAPDTAKEIMRAAGLEPLVPYSGRIKDPWPSRCTARGHEIAPSLGGILNGQGACRKCADERTAASRREDPQQAAADMRAAGLEPLEPYTGADTPWRCRCATCGREVRPRLARVRQGGGCRFCASHGIDLTGPADVYVITHPTWAAVKVGIGACTGPTNRLDQHRRAGWIVVHRRTFPTGATAYDVEQAVLDKLRSAGLVPFLSSTIMPNGWTETADASLIHADTLWQMVEEAADSIGTGKVTAGGPRRKLSAHGLIDPGVAIAQMQNAGLQPLKPYPGRATLPWRCRCMTCGSESTPRLSGIRRGRGGCRPCATAAVTAAKITAKAQDATAVMKAAGFEPLEPYPGSARPWRCRCGTCDQESTPTYSNVRGGTGCRHCRNKGGLHGGFDPELAAAQMRAAGLEPLQPYPGTTMHPWPCRCLACGKESSPRLSSVRTGHGCRHCGIQRRAAARRTPRPEPIGTDESTLPVF
ncbi:GIY-YIG nuclease family protein [Actinacidiphila glaucinigra]|uniref:GIY-YIG nuclease family protein n=1 Tax=Actinacidiphila glaucinigra TaxID=235986 RepID=UPI0033A5B2ED